MFTWLNKQGVKSDAGFTLQFTGRFTAEYLEGERKVSLDVEDGSSDGAPCVIVDPSAFERWDDGTPIAPEKRAQLFQNLKEAVEFQALRLVVEAAEKRERGT